MDISLLEKNLHIELTKKTKENFQTFVKLFNIYNTHTNLISKKDVQNLFEKHIYDSLALSLFLDKCENKQLKLLDIGTGGGFPSLPLAMAYEDLQIYPLDSIAKKIGFIELVQKELRLKNIYPLCKRVEELPSEMKCSFDIAVSRAVASLNILLEYAIPYVKTGGYFVAYKSVNADNEIENAKNAMKILNANVVYRIKYELPLAENFTRELIVIQKQKDTNLIYPRTAAMIKKNPL